MKQNPAQKGYASLLGILILAAVLTLAAAGGYIFYSKKITSALPVQTTVTSPSLAPSASPSLSSESGVRNRWCLSKDPSLLPVYKCDPKTYKIPPAGPGMSVRYADEKGDEITSCGGSIPNIQESEKCKSLELLKCEENICDKTDETANWKTYTDPANLFSFEYPDFVKLTDINAAYNESSFADINISFPISPLDIPPWDQTDLIFQLSIKVINNARKTTQQFIQESNKPNYRISSIKPYKNGEIDGTYYSVLDKTSETSANIEKIIQTRGDLLYIFEYESWNGAFVKGRGKDTVQKILSTFKFLP